VHGCRAGCFEVIMICLSGSYRQWDSNWERMLYDGKYLTDDEFLLQKIINASYHGVAEVLR